MGRFYKGGIFFIAVLHLTLVGLSAFYVEVPDYVPHKKLIDFYRKSSGADSSYGFFAPSISVKTRGLFDVIDKNGVKIATTPLIPNAKQETFIRLGGIFDEFTSEESADENFRQPLAASLASAIFSRYPEGFEVVFYVEEFWPTSMQEYRQGVRTQWSEYYRAHFSKAEN